ncbi:DUF1028 domain-containing protein [Nocardia ignorata]|uniref:Putative Ntn-hydrolase superfamily protein n=1 Tax=Nocardia ignorata TaxID=145285 RepID=A0A4R6P2D3_NOCIG|nr:DUF1028 domain-containing protein [Nocardia ignorata]TDP31884.1 putative Ntn-hydrolase superfamily protein [Nocardia ignorata]
MTFSLLAIDGDGAIGMAVTSSSPAVAARCIHLRAGVGGAASQNVTDPRLGTALLDALDTGLDAPGAMDRVVADRDHIDFRQLTVLGLDGAGAAFSGAGALGIHADRVGPGVVAAGNLLARPEVVDAVVDGFAAATGELEQRLVAALVAGQAAGGEVDPVRSAGLAVVRDVPWRVTDLRVDWSEQPIEDLGRLLDVWLPQRDDYVTRGLNPTAAPSFGVGGDE